MQRLLLALTLAAACAAPPALAARAQFGHAKPSVDVQRLADWVVMSGDNRTQPFAIIDKPHARLYVFRGNGVLRGQAPVLLGLARGDDTVPGIGDKPLSQIKVHERTTPAGRFVGEHGLNAHHVHVIWVDYDAAVSMHPVITSNPKERRQHRLDTATIRDNRISYGCVNVPKPFFANVVLKTLTQRNPMIYVVPETRPIAVQFASLAQAAAQAQAGKPRPATRVAARAR